MTREHRLRPRRAANRQRENRGELGQNFLKDRQTARRIVAASGVGGDDLVVEIGAGGGMLTRELARAARRVTAIECDPYWAAHLRKHCDGAENVSVVQGDVLEAKLPDEPFAVVANLPFGITTPILHRLLDDPEGPLLSAHLVVQKPVALKHASPTPTTLKTLTWSPWYQFTASLRLPAEVFCPRPSVDACLMVATKRSPPLVDARHRHLFRALVRRGFEVPGNVVGKTLRPYFTRTQLRRLAKDNGFSLNSAPSALTVHQWSSVFRFMALTVPREQWPPPGPRAGKKRRRGGRRRLE